MDKFQFSLCEKCQKQTQIHVPHPFDPSLLHSDCIPSVAELSQRLKSLEANTQEITRCKIKIAYLHRQLEELESVKEKLENHVARLRSFTSVWRRVPVELWKIIFTYASSSSSSDGSCLEIGTDNSKRTTVTMFPVILTHVCSRWRTIAIGYPQLWSSITLFSLQLTKGAQSLLQMFLVNSAGCPMVFRVLESGGISRERYQATWNLLAPHLLRSRQLILYIDYDRSLVSAFQGLDVTFNNLSSISFRRTRFGNNEREFNDNLFWRGLRQRAQNLVKVHIFRVFPRDLLPYSQLTSLAIDLILHRDLLELLRILEVSESLCSLTLNNLNHLVHDQAFNVLPRRVNLLSLHTLIISNNRGRRAVPINSPILGVIFGSLVMPSLSTFKLMCGTPFESDGPPAWPSSLLTMLQHSSMTLRQMELSLQPGHPPTPWPALSVLFRTTSHLNHLDLEFVPQSFISLSLSDLTFNEHDTLLPNLDRLSLLHIRLTRDIVNTVLGLAASRSSKNLSTVDHVHPLKELHIEHILSWDLPRAVLEPHEAIKNLERDGVRVVIKEGKIGRA